MTKLFNRNFSMNKGYFKIFEGEEDARAFIKKTFVHPEKITKGQKEYLAEYYKVSVRDIGRIIKCLLPKKTSTKKN